MRRVAFEVTAGNDASLVATLTRQHGRTLTELRDGEDWKGESLARAPVRSSVIGGKAEIFSSVWALPPLNPSGHSEAYSACLSALVRRPRDGSVV